MNPDELIGAAKTEDYFIDDEEDGETWLIAFMGFLIHQFPFLDVEDDVLMEWIKYYESLGMIEKADEMRNQLKKHDTSI